MHPKDYDSAYNKAKNMELEKINTQKRQMMFDKIDIGSALVKFIVKERLPISKVNSVHLNELIQGTYRIVLYFVSSVYLIFYIYIFERVLYISG